MDGWTRMKQINPFLQLYLFGTYLTERGMSTQFRRYIDPSAYVEMLKLYKC